ncbi:hypothetical protein WCV49_34160, partial [Klebsiella pneumoniae]
MASRACGHHIVDQNDAMSLYPVARHKGIAQVTLPGVAREAALRRGRAFAPEPSGAGGTLHLPGRNAREFPSLVEAASG